MPSDEIPKPVQFQDNLQSARYIPVGSIQGTTEVREGPSIGVQSFIRDPVVQPLSEDEMTVKQWKDIIKKGLPTVDQLYKLSHTLLANSNLNQKQVDEIYDKTGLKHLAPKIEPGQTESLPPVIQVPRFPADRSRQLEDVPESERTLAEREQALLQSGQASEFQRRGIQSEIKKENERRRREIEARQQRALRENFPVMQAREDNLQPEQSKRISGPQRPAPRRQQPRQEPEEKKSEEKKSEEEEEETKSTEPSIQPLNARDIGLIRATLMNDQLRTEFDQILEDANIGTSGTSKRKVQQNDVKYLADLLNATQRVENDIDDLENKMNSTNDPTQQKNIQSILNEKRLLRDNLLNLREDFKDRTNPEIFNLDKIQNEIKSEFRKQLRERVAKENEPERKSSVPEVTQLSDQDKEQIRTLIDSPSIDIVPLPEFTQMSLDAFKKLTPKKKKVKFIERMLGLDWDYLKEKYDIKKPRRGINQNQRKSDSINNFIKENKNYQSNTGRKRENLSGLNVDHLVDLFSTLTGKQ